MLLCVCQLEELSFARLPLSGYVYTEYPHKKELLQEATHVAVDGLILRHLLSAQTGFG